VYIYNKITNLTNTNDRKTLQTEDFLGPYYSLGWEAQECCVEAYYNLAKISEEMGNNEQAIKYYRHFVDIWKNADEDIPLLQDAKLRLISSEALESKKVEKVE